MNSPQSSVFSLLTISRFHCINKVEIRKGVTAMAETIKQTAGREQLGNFAPQFAHINDDVLFGEVWNEKAIDLKTKCLVTVVALMSSGITDSSLRYHLQNAKSNGVTREEIAAVITHAAMYAGIPKGWAAFRLAKDIWKNDAAVSFEEIFASEDSKVRDMSELASAIIKDYYDPLLGEEQNDYMIEMFQSYTSIKNQLAAGKRYFFVKENGRNIGFICFYPTKGAMYLSKLYLQKDARGKGYARKMLRLIRDEALKIGLHAIELNVNKGNESRFIYEKLGFQLVRSEKNDIGSGFYMDDYVYRIEF